MFIKGDIEAVGRFYDEEKQISFPGLFIVRSGELNDPEVIIIADTNSHTKAIREFHSVEYVEKVRVKSHDEEVNIIRGKFSFTNNIVELYEIHYENINMNRNEVLIGDYELVKSIVKSDIMKIIKMNLLKSSIVSLTV